MTQSLTPPTGHSLMPRTVGRMAVRNHRYFDGVDSYQRTSTLLKNIETDTYHLDEWRANTLAIGLAQRADLVVGVAAAAQFGPDGKLTREAKDSLRGIRQQAMEAGKAKAGATQGTAIHTATERLDLGETVVQIGLPYPFNADLRAYKVLKDAMGLVTPADLIERSVRHRGHGVVGTWDRAAHCQLLVDMGVLDPEEMIVVDVKTEGAPLLNLMHIAPQLADYAYADDMFVPQPTPDNEYAGVYVDMPKVSRTVGLVIHLRDGRAVPYLVNLVAGWRQVLRAVDQRNELAASKAALGSKGCWAVLVPVQLPPATEATAAAHERGPLGFSAPAGTTPEEYRAEPAVVEQAVRAPDGTTTWTVVPEIPAGPQPLEAMLWQAIGAAPDMGSLAHLFERATATGVAWEGPIADAGIVRARIIQCQQRAMHNPATTSKCGCGWTRGQTP